MLLAFKVKAPEIVSALTIYTLISLLDSVPKRTEAAERRDETYNTVIATHKLMQRSIAELLSEEALTQAQFYALRVVARNGAMLMRKISEEMLVTPATITGIVDRLERKGLVKRMARQGDRRATIIELTPEGRAVQERVATRYSELMQRALHAFTTDEQRALRHLLEKLQQEMSRSRG